MYLFQTLRDKEGGYPKLTINMYVCKDMYYCSSYFMVHVFNFINKNQNHKIARTIIHIFTTRSRNEHL